MSDFIEELWSAFTTETEEHLIGFNLLLKKAENGLTPEETAILYRDVHSVANLARAMDLTGMAQVAHGCEVVALIVREGRAEIDSGLIKLLGESHAALSQMRQVAVMSRKDSEPPDGLADRLEKASTSLSANTKSDLSKAPASAALHKDPKMLEFYGSILTDNIPRLTSIVSGDYDGTGQQREIATEALSAIKKASEGMGYDHVTGLLERLAPQIPAQGSLASRIEEVAPMFVELKQMIDNFERETKVNAGGDKFSPALKEISLSKLNSLFEEMIESLTLCKGHGSADDPESRQALGDRVSSLAKSAHGYMRFASPGSTGYAMIFLEDIFNRIGRDEIALDNEVISISVESVMLERLILNEKNLDYLSELETESNRLIEKIKDIISAGERSRYRVESDAEAQALLSKVKIKPEMTRLISAENMSDLLDALRKGWRLFEITTYLESDEQMAEAFMEWAQNRAKVITNRSLIIGKESWFEFLVACESPSEVVFDEIKTINPKGDFLQVREC